MKVPAKNSPALLFLSRGKAARPLVLTDWRKGVFSLIHSLTLMGPRATARLIAKWYVCPEMSKQLTRWAQECHKCQQPMAHQARSSGLRDPKEILHSSAHRCGGTTPHVQRLQIRTHSHQQENKVFGGPTNGGRLRQVICPARPSSTDGNNTPAEIVSYQGRTFTSELWEEFQKAMCTKHSYQHY